MKQLANTYFLQLVNHWQDQIQFTNQTSRIMKSLLSISLAITILLAGCQQLQNKEATIAPNGGRQAAATLTIVGSVPSSLAWGATTAITISVQQNGQPLRMSNVTVSLVSGNGAIAIPNNTVPTDVNGRATFRLSIRDRLSGTNVSSEGLGNHQLRFTLVGSSSSVATGNINVLVPVGWSHITGFRHTWTGNQVAILRVARQYLGRGMAPTSTIVPGKTWQTDMDDNDGIRLREAMTLYAAYRSNTRNPVQPDTKTVASMNLALNKSISGATGYSIAADRTAIVNRIVERFALYNLNRMSIDVMPYLGVLAQCKETRDRIIRDAGLVSLSYGQSTILSVSTANTALRAGMVGNQYSKGAYSHTFIISSVEWSATGTATRMRVIDSNFNNSFNRPTGDFPWSRQMRETDRALSWAYNFERF